MVRRATLRVLLGGFSIAWSVRGSSAGVQPAIRALPRELLRGFRRSQAFERRYRADAAVSFGGVTIFSRRGVGGAYASVETGHGNEGTAPASPAVALHFLAGSDPARCAGLNRFGILQEAIVDSGADLRFSFAGLITESKEENLEDAKKALHASVGQKVKLARGAASGGRVETWTETVEADHPCMWSDSGGLLSALAQKAPGAPVHELYATASPFLSAVRSAALSEEPTSHRPFVHASKLYTLELHRRSNGERDGVIRDVDGAKLADFRVAYATGDPSGLPVRIEYRAKPYLKLVFEADETAVKTGTEPLFSKES